MIGPSFLTRNWPDKLLALLFAAIIFWVVDRQITATIEETLVIETTAERVTRGTDRTLVVLPAESRASYSIAIEPRPDEPRLERHSIVVRFSGPRQAIADLRSGTISGILRVDRKMRPGNDEESWTIPASKIAFSGVDERVVTIDAPDVTLKASRIEERRVDVTIEGDLTVHRPQHHDIGQPVPITRSVVIRGPARLVRAARAVADPTPAEAERIGRAPGLAIGDNTVQFRVAIRGATDEDPVEIEPAVIDVNVPIVPRSTKLEIEVPIDLILPSDGSFRSHYPHPPKPRETFTFIGPTAVLNRCKALEGTHDEIRAQIDLSRLDTSSLDRLKAQGSPLRPRFLFPDFAAGRIQCEQIKPIWITTSKDDE